MINYIRSPIERGRKQISTILPSVWAHLPATYLRARTKAARKNQTQYKIEKADTKGSQNNLTRRAGSPVYIRALQSKSSAAIAFSYIDGNSRIISDANSFFKRDDYLTKTDMYLQAMKRRDNFTIRKVHALQYRSCCLLRTEQNSTVGRGSCDPRSAGSVRKS